jgi:hypothetical protein
MYEHDGPFATVYFEARSPAEDAEHQLDLRWEDLRHWLAESGAPDTVLDQLDDAVRAPEQTSVHASGRVLVATTDGVLFDDAFDASQGAGDRACWQEQPDLGDYLRERQRFVRMLVVIAHQTEAAIRQVHVAQSHSLDERSSAHIDGEDAVSKPRENGMHHSKIQNRADEVVKQNLEDVAETVRDIARRWHPDVVVIAGEVQGRTALRDELSDDQLSLREVEAGGTDDATAEKILAEALQDLAEELTQQRANDNLHRYEYGLAHNTALAGAQAVADSAQQGAVETLLLEYDRPATNEAELVAAAMRTGANTELIDAHVDDGVAALLRFEAAPAK